MKADIVDLEILLGMILNREWLDQSSQVDWQQASAVPTTDGDDVQHAITWNTDRENCVAEVAVHIAHMLRRRGLCRHSFRPRRSQKSAKKKRDKEDEG